MTKHIWMGTLFAASLTVLGCDRESRVKHEIEDLREAEQNSPQRAKELEQEANEKKRELERLEEKAALARQGVTDEVVEERKELNEALKRQEQHVREEVKEAQGAAATHNRESEHAAQQLGRTEGAQPVEAEVRTETRTLPGGGNQVQVTREQENIPVERNRVIERPTTQPVDPNTAGTPAPTDTPRTEQIPRR